MTFVCPDPRTTQQLATAIAHQVFPGAVILLQGDLGSGKTTFVQGLGQGLGIGEPITSPTFIVIQEYEGGRLPLFHCDCYRLDPAGVMELGLEELWQRSGVTVIEWPERLPQWPAQWLWLRFIWGANPQARQIQAQWQGQAHQHLWQQALVEMGSRSEGSLTQGLPKPETKP